MNGATQVVPNNRAIECLFLLFFLVFSHLHVMNIMQHLHNLSHELLVSKDSCYVVTRSIAFINILLYFPTILVFGIRFDWLGVSNLRLTWTKQLHWKEVSKIASLIFSKLLQKSKCDPCQMVSVWSSFCVKVPIYTNRKNSDLTNQRFAKCGLRTSLTWEFVRNTNSQVHPDLLYQ